MIRLSIEKCRRLQTANYSFFKEPYLHPDRVMPAHDIVLIVAGGWEICEENERFMLGPGDAIFLFAGRRHYGERGCEYGTRTMWVHAYPERDDAFIRTAAVGRNTDSALYLPTVIRTGGDPRVISLFEGIVQNYWSSSATNRMRSRVLFSELMLELSALAHTAHDPAANAIDYIVNLIEMNPAKNYSIDALAKAVGMNRRTLTMQFRKRMKRSIHQFAVAHKVRMAASVFAHAPGTPVRVVASMFGFYDEFHFSRTFKQLTGAAPTEYKKGRSQP